MIIELKFRPRDVSNECLKFKTKTRNNWKEIIEKI